MRYAVDPLQKLLFDPSELMFSPMTLKFLRGDWPGLFRAQVLHLMPAEALGESFHETLGCPTKELYGMAGGVFLKDFFDLTIEQSVERYLLDAGWQYALNINPIEASMSHATIERYIKLFKKSPLAGEIFHRVTSAFIETLELDISRQRLDSTHIFSDMAVFGRTKLMGVTIKRFLTQLKRQHRKFYDDLPEELRTRYLPSQGKLFADDRSGRKQLRQTVAEDLLFLVSRFAEEADIIRRTSYKALQRVLEEQCDVVEEQVVLKEKTTGKVMQNPSDPEASYDGHKGPGYQAQIAETCGEGNEVQLITSVMVEPAHACDQEALAPTLDELDDHDRLPDLLYTDTSYGRDENVVEAAQRGVDLQSPVSGPSPGNADDLSLDDFVIDDKAEVVVSCPNGCKPRRSEHNQSKGKTRTVMNSSDCSSCAFLGQCPVKQVGGDFVLCHTPKQRRIAERRAEQGTEVFRENYAVRAGGESVNSGLKRKLGLARVRVRGAPAVSMAVLLRCAGWNLLRALQALKKRGIRDFTSYFAVLGRRPGVLASRRKPDNVVLSYPQLFRRQPGDIYPSVAA
jgi:hypothetical protein